MNSYIITYKTPEGEIAERSVEARSHKAAQKAFAAETGLELVSIERADDEYLEPGGKQAKTATSAIVFGIIVAAAVVALFWWRRGCPGLELLK